MVLGTRLTDCIVNNKLYKKCKLHKNAANCTKTVSCTKDSLNVFQKNCIRIVLDTRLTDHIFNNNLCENTIPSYFIELEGNTA